MSSFHHVRVTVLAQLPQTWEKHWFCEDKDRAWQRYFDLCVEYPGHVVFVKPVTAEENDYYNTMAHFWESVWGDVFVESWQDMTPRMQVRRGIQGVAHKLSLWYGDRYWPWSW